MQGIRMNYWKGPEMVTWDAEGSGGPLLEKTRKYSGKEK